MTALVRLSFWVAPERLRDFEAAYERQLAPLLASRELGNASQGDQPSATGVFSRHFTVETPTAVAQLERTLRQDKAWSG